MALTQFFQFVCSQVHAELHKALNLPRTLQFGELCLEPPWIDSVRRILEPLRQLDQMWVFAAQQHRWWIFPRLDTNREQRDEPVPVSQSAPWLAVSPPRGASLLPSACMTAWAPHCSFRGSITRPTNSLSTLRSTDRSVTTQDSLLGWRPVLCRAVSRTVPNAVSWIHHPPPPRPGFVWRTIHTNS